MRAAVRRFNAGRPGRLPYRLLRQVIAERLGQLPSTIDAMPADDFWDAVGMMEHSPT
jgi:hypothetical protein